MDPHSDLGKPTIITPGKDSHSSDTWSEAPASVADLATEIIAKYHYELLEARIGFLFRKTHPISHGKMVLGHASKVSEQLKPFLDFDFIIWIAEDIWNGMTTDRRRALIDHELCHCKYDDEEGPSLAGHDFEEFIEIVERYGYWTTDLLRLKEATSQLKMSFVEVDPLTLEHRGHVATITGEQLHELANKI